MESGQRLTAVVLLLLAGVALPGCGAAKDDRRPYVYDTPLARELAAFRLEGPHGATRRLAQLTSFDWEAVHIFAEGTSFRYVDHTVGFELFGRDGHYDDNGGTLLIFTINGKLASAQALRAPLLLGSRKTTFSREHAAVRALTPDPGPYGFELVASTH